MSYNNINRDELLEKIFNYILINLRLHIHISDIIAIHNGRVYIIYDNNINWFEYHNSTIKNDESYLLIFKSNYEIKNYIFNGDSSLISDSDFRDYNMKKFPINVIMCHTNINEVYSNVGVLFYVPAIDKSWLCNLHPDDFDSVFVQDYTNDNFKLIDGI